MTPDEAYIVLNLIPGVGPVRVRRLLQHYESPQSILSETVANLARLPGIGPKLADQIGHWEKHVDLAAELRLVSRAGVTVVNCENPAYPEFLKEIHDPPICLYVRGELETMNRKSGQYLAVVGSRRMTRYGADMTERLVRAAVATDWVIVSGLARGIDTAAHQVCVQSGGTTIAVMGSGLGHIYPQENVSLAREICTRGAVITEQPMMMKPDRRTFPMRNRIIAGISKAVLVVEAGVKSGSLITAHQALEQGRLVFAVPGPANQEHSRGCHSLIKQGAKLVETLDDIVEEFDLLPNVNWETMKLQAEAPRASQAVLIPELDEPERRIMKCLAEGELTVDQLVALTDEDVGSLLTRLFLMEIKRVIRQLPGKRFVLNNQEALSGH